MPSVMNRTEPSAKATTTPPGCRLEGGSTLPFESALGLLSLTHAGPLGPITVLNATRSAWPSHHRLPNLAFTFPDPGRNLPLAALARHWPGFLFKLEMNE